MGLAHKLQGYYRGAQKSARRSERTLLSFETTSLRSAIRVRLRRGTRFYASSFLHTFLARRKTLNAASSLKRRFECLWFLLPTTQPFLNGIGMSTGYHIFCLQAFYLIPTTLLRRRT